MTEREKAMRELIASCAGTIITLKDKIDQIQSITHMVADTIQADDPEEKHNMPLTALYLVEDDLSNDMCATLIGLERDVEAARKAMQ